MTNSEKRVLIREFSRVLNKLEPPIKLLNGLLLLPNLEKNLRKALEDAGYESPEPENAILRDDPKAAFNEALDNLRDILQWFVHHPNIILKCDANTIEPAKSLETHIQAMADKEEKFLEGYLNGEFPTDVVTLAEVIKLLREIEVGMLTYIGELIGTLPEEERQVAVMEYLTLSEKGESAEGFMAFAPQSYLVN